MQFHERMLICISTQHGYIVGGLPGMDPLLITVPVRKTGLVAGSFSRAGRPQAVAQASMHSLEFHYGCVVDTIGRQPTRARLVQARRL